MRFPLLCSFLIVTFLGCGGGGSSSSVPIPQAPATVTYTTSTVTYRVGVAITPNTPSTTGGAPASYGVNPGLPSGLSISTTTGIISGTPSTVTAQASYTVTAFNSGGSAQATLSITVILAPGSWSSTGSMGVARTLATATVLQNGHVLVVGGANASAECLATCEVYDPSTGVWAATGALTTGRNRHTATLLTNGKVLVVSGIAGTVAPYVQTTSAEIYDPTSGTWASAGNLSNGRQEHTATLLTDGRVLISGGGGNLGAAEIYDPGTSNWSITGALTANRQGHTATLLPNGEVLVAGGYNQSIGALSTSEVYEPVTGKWLATGSMVAGRFYAASSLLPGGKVLVAGGSGINANEYLSSAEIYDFTLGTWTSTTAMNSIRREFTSNLLSDGTVLVAGGYDQVSGNPIFLSGVEIFDPTTGAWKDSGDLITGRMRHMGVLLQNGKVLVVGGQNLSGMLMSAETH